MTSNFLEEAAFPVTNTKPILAYYGYKASCSMYYNELYDYGMQHLHAKHSSYHQPPWLQPSVLQVRYQGRFLASSSFQQSYIIESELFSAIQSDVNFKTEKAQCLVDLGVSLLCSMLVATTI